MPSPLQSNCSVPFSPNLFFTGELDMIIERSSESHSIAGFTNTTPSYTHLRSISFDNSYLPPLPQEAYQQTHVQELYPIVSAWSIDDDDTDYHRFREEDDDLELSSSLPPMVESILNRARENSKIIKRKLSCLTPRKVRSREGSSDGECDDGIYDPQPSEWSSSTESNFRSYSQWEAIRLRVSIYLYWKRQALARKLTLRPTRS